MARDRFFYLAENRYGDSTSCGFANTWQVLVFRSKKDRDQYAEENADNQGVRIIRKRDIGTYMDDDRPRPFQAAAWRITPYSGYPVDVEGMVGVVVLSEDRTMERVF